MSTAAPSLSSLIHPRTWGIRKRVRAAWRALWLRCRPLDVHPEERRPLRLLENAIRKGATLRFHEGTYYLIEGERCTAGDSLDEVAFLSGLELGKVHHRQPHVRVKLSRGLVAGFDTVRATGEGLSAFLREAMVREIERRREEDRLALCGGFLDGDAYALPAVIVESETEEVARAA